MIALVRQQRKIICLMSYLERLKNQRFLTSISLFVRDYSEIGLSTAAQNRNLLVGTDQFRLILSRHKSKQRKRPKQDEEDSSDEEDELEAEDDFDRNVNKLKTFSVNSLRIDGILKTALGISRKRVEECFYQNKIRVNGEIVTKKSQKAGLDDEIDLILGFESKSSNHLKVNRIKIVKVELNPDAENMVVKVLVEKSLRISNYSKENSWSQTE